MFGVFHVSESVALLFFDDVCGKSTRSIPFADILRHGWELSSKHDFDTWLSRPETRRHVSIPSSTIKANNWVNDDAYPRPKSDSNLAILRSCCWSCTLKLMNERSSSSSSASRNSVAHPSIAEGFEDSYIGIEHQAELQELKKARKTVALHRDELFRRRLWLKERRNALQEERTNVAEIEADLMTSIRQQFNESVLSEPSLARSLYAELESKRAALEAKRDELGALQYDYDQAEIDHNLKETELDEEEQHFESLLSEVLGLSDSSEGDPSDNSSIGTQRYKKSETPPSPAFEPDQAQILATKLRANSDSVFATIQQSVPIAGPRINWWILHTFGCSPIDYVQRAQDKASLQGSNGMNLDDESWARRVFNFWRLEEEPAEAAESSEDSGAELSTEELPEPKHSGRFTIGGSYLLLSSALSKAKCTVKNYDRLFDSDPEILQDDSVSQDLGRNVSPISAPAGFGSFDPPV